jgi:small subunit ribosomal protein S4
VDIPSFQVRVGDVISLRERSKKVQFIQDSLATPSLARPSYLEFDAEKQTAKMINVPAREDVPITDLRDNLIIEYYSRKV